MVVLTWIRHIRGPWLKKNVHRCANMWAHSPGHSRLSRSLSSIAWYGTFTHLPEESLWITQELDSVAVASSEVLLLCASFDRNWLQGKGIFTSSAPLPAVLFFPSRKRSIMSSELTPRSLCSFADASQSLVCLSCFSFSSWVGANRLMMAAGMPKPAHESYQRAWREHKLQRAWGVAWLSARTR